MQVREFHLVRGKAHTGKKGWIVRFHGVDSLDEVCLLCTPACGWSHLFSLNPCV
jgi:hypothetical protein